MAEAAIALKAIALAVSPIITKLADNYFGGGVSTDMLRDLKTVTLPKIATVIEAAEVIHVDQLKPWLLELKAAAYAAEDVLDEYEYRCTQKQVSSYHTLKKFESKAKEFLGPIFLKTKIRYKLEKLEKVAGRVDEFINLLRVHNDFKNNANIGSDGGIGSTQPTTMNQYVTVSSPPGVVFGRDQERNYLINMLTLNNNELDLGGYNWKVPIHAIYGIGGSGKTTLAQYIFNDPRIADHFGDMRLWVHVSRKFDVLEITRKMIESATRGECPHMESLDALQAKLKEILSNANNQVFLVLDDLWCDEAVGRIQLEKLLLPLREVGYKGSRVLITTRTERVALMSGAKIMVPLKELESKDCWSILKHYAFGDANKAIDDPELSKIGEQIVEKLKNSPLAAKMVGIQLENKVHVGAWRMILDSDMLMNTRNVLLWSFKQLPPHLQRCFAFCSLYPKSMIFTPYDLIDLFHIWSAEGLIQVPGRNELTMEEIGRLYFEDLLSYSFFQLHNIFTDSYVIHDLLHDLAEEVSKDDCFRIETDDAKPIPDSVIHVFFWTHNLVVHMPNICKLANLRTVAIVSSHEIDINNMHHDLKRMFKKLRKLRVLHLRSCTMSELPSSVGHLRHLRYLNVSNLKKLPKSIAKLYRLQFLDMSGCEIDSVSEGLNNLINMRHLDCKSISMIPEFGKLTSLEILKELHANKKRGHGIEQLKNLRELRGTLTILELENVKDATDATEAMLDNKKHLSELKLKWDSCSGRDGRTDLEVLEGLKPPANLRDLAIEGYMGALSPSWMLYDLCLSNLQSLELLCCYNWRVLPPLGHLPLLGTLQISWAMAVEEVGHEFYGSDDKVAFPSLKVLKLENMESWVRWSGIKDIDMFPCLHELVIDHCPKLMEVPCLPQSLKELQIKSCRNLVKVASLPNNLRKLWIWGCHNLVQLSPFPSNLEKLYINGCPGVENLMSEISCGDEVEKQDTISTCHLSLRVAISCNMKILKCSQKLISMFDLRVDGCPSLTTFLLGHHLTALQKLFIGYCKNLDSLVGIEALTCLRRLSVVSCPRLTMSRMQGHEDGGKLLPSSLVSLEIRKCDNVVNTLLKSCLSLISLSDLIIEDCPGLQSLENLRHLKALSNLCIRDCPDLTSVGNLKSLTSLKILGVFKCPKLATSTRAGKSNILPSSITNLSIDQPSLLIELLQKEGLAALQALFLAYLSQDTPFTAEQEEKFYYLTSLEYLCFYNCENLPSLPTNLKRLYCLKRLRLEYCPKIESLPELPHSLKILKIYRCHPQLTAEHQK